MKSKYKDHQVIPHHIAVDSLKIRLPIDPVEILSPNLVGKWYLVHEHTGEIDPKVYKDNSLTFIENGITTRFAIERQQTRDGLTSEFVTILVNSKELKEDYFQGITAETIESVHRSLLNHKVISISFEDFYNLAEVTDVDIKKDGKVPEDVYQKCINQCRTISKPSKNKNKGYRFFNKRNNKGIEWSDRRTTAFKSNPYLKIYHKETELNHNSNEFASKYLKNTDYMNLVRVETTIKNAKHFRELGVNSNRLRDVLELPQEKLQEIMDKALKSHLEPRIREIKENNKLTPTELIYYGSIMLCASNGVSYESYKTNVLNLIENKTERHRKRKVLDNIYKRFVKGTNEDQESKKKDVFWNLLNW